MGTINPETLYNKIYSDSPFKNNTVIMDEVTTKDFREFLQRTKPNFENSGDSSEKELLESLSKLVHTKTDIDINSCKKVCNDIQDNFCSSLCNTLETASPSSTRVVIGGIFITLTAALIYKIRMGSISANKLTHTCSDKKNAISETESQVQPDEEVIEPPRIVHIRRPWFFW